MTATLDQALLAAHDRADIDALIGLYQQAAETAETETAAGFFLTHAYIFALERGDSRAGTLRDALVRSGRESVDIGDPVTLPD